MAERTLLQFFHWYYPEGGHLWKEVAEKAESLAAMGITDLWIPPAYKGATGPSSVGYDTYDLFDLGEFDQKGGIATKYGDRAALQNAIATLREKGLRVMHDVVLNHKMGADELETVQVRRVDPDNRTDIEEDAFEAQAYTRFTFPGRNGTHSRFVWDMKCFSGVDHIHQPDENGIFRLINEYGDGEWDTEVDEEYGNFDYLMGNDVEFRNRAVYDELIFWGEWLAKEVGVDGFRLDAAKHIPAWFFRDWVGHMRQSINPELLVVAEYWHPDPSVLRTYLDRVDQQLMLFDVALHHRFHDASQAGEDFDLRTIFDGALVVSEPDYAVTLVDNHDTQPLQSLEAPVAPWFKPLAYALILLREKGLPCVFYPDLYGAHYTDTGHDGGEYTIEMPRIESLPKLIEARRKYAKGMQTDLFDTDDCLAFIRHGTETEPGCVVIITNRNATQKSITLGSEQAGVAFRDFLGHRNEEITTDENGTADFTVEAGSVSVWVRADSL